MVEFIFPKDARPHSAAEIGAALTGFVVREPSGLPRVGMLGEGPTVSAVGSSWKVEVGPFVYASQVSGSVSFSGITSAQQVDIVSAAGIPAGQSRIDLVCWDPSAGELVVVEGIAAGTPSAPTTVHAPVGRVLVKSGDGMVIAGQVSKAYQFADRVTGVITSFAAGYTAGVGTTIEKDSTGMVDAYVELSRGSGSIGSDQLMATMPAGFRPGPNLEFAGTVSQGSSAAAPVFVRIAPNGQIRVFNPAAGALRCSFIARYRAVT